MPLMTAASTTSKKNPVARRSNHVMAKEKTDPEGSGLKQAEAKGVFDFPRGQWGGNEDS